MLEATHEGTMDVRRARKHTLVFKYEAFSNEEWGNHFRTSNKIHSHYEPSPWSRKNILRLLC